MKNIKQLLIFIMSLNFCSCVTWVREEKSEKITQGMVGAIIETKFSAIIAKNPKSKNDTLNSEYFLVSPKIHGPNLPEGCYVVENCPAGTRGQVIRFIKERDAGQFIWTYVELEMNDLRLKQKYRIIRIAGQRGNLEGMPWSEGRDFRVVTRISQ